MRRRCPDVFDAWLVSSDPLLNTFIFEPEDELADTIFHELTHERLFMAGDTDFNEAFATMVAQEGVRRWFSRPPTRGAMSAIKRVSGTTAIL
jgi:predicted aminopeptidase